MILCFYKKRQRGAMIFLIGLIVGVVHHLTWLFLDDVEAVFVYTAFFLISFGWFIVLGWIGEIFSEMIASILTLFMMLLTIDCVISPGYETIISSLDSIVITSCNIAMLIAGAADSGSFNINNSRLFSELQSAKKASSNSHGVK